MVVLHLIAGLAIWTGGSLTGGPPAVDDALGGAINSAPVAWLAVGASTLAVGWLPSAVGIAGAVPVVGGFLLNVVTQGVNRTNWVIGAVALRSPRRCSQRVARVACNGGFHAIGAVFVALGIAGYSRRDLTT